MKQTSQLPTPYTWAELRKKWEHDQISSEQMLGQLLVWGELMHTQLVLCQRQLESQLENRQRQSDALTAQAATPGHRLEQRQT